MKKLIIICPIMLIILCLVLFAVISGYTSINLLISCGIILITAIILLLLHFMINNDAFKASLTVLFALFGIIALIASFFAPQHINDNWLIISFTILCGIEIIIIFFVKLINK